MSNLGNKEVMAENIQRFLDISGKLAQKYVAI